MSTTFAKSLLAAAAEVEAAELSIKHEILRAAESGDCGRVTDIVTRWLNSPAVGVLAGSGPEAQAPASMELASCGAPEVTQGTHPREGDGSTPS